MKLIPAWSRAVAWLVGAVIASGCGDAAGPSPTPVNRRPRIVAPALSVLHDREYRETIVVEDPDGDSVTVSAEILPEWMTFDSPTRVLSGHPTLDLVGEHLVKLKAHDGQARDTLSFLVRVVLRTSDLVSGGPWSKAVYPYKHDGHPHLSAHFAVYNDFSALEERRYVSEALEGHFQDIKPTLGIVTNQELDGWTPETRIDVLSLRAQVDTVIWNGTAYRYGFVVHAPDSRRYAQAGYTRALYDQLLRHEAMHVVEYYLVGSAGTDESVEKWFQEGAAMVMGGVPPGRIRSVGELRRWRESMASYAGQGNPVLIKSERDYPLEIQADAKKLGGYYLAFELAVRYLLDPKGGGRTPQDVKRMYLAIREGVPFAPVFEEVMGLSVQGYEAGFWTFMEGYLGSLGL